MDKYIKKEDLGEALKTIARCALENAESLRTEIGFRENWSGTGVAMEIKVMDAKTYCRLKEVTYVIVGDSALDSEQMYAESLAIKAHADKVQAEQEAQAAAAKEQEVESNNEEE